MGIVFWLDDFIALILYYLLLAHPLFSVPNSPGTKSIQFGANMFIAIHPLDNWEAINSFSNWLSAVGTISAVIVALWLANRDRHVSIAGRFSIGMIPSSNPNILDRLVFVLNFANTGIRQVTVTNHYWKLPLMIGIVFMLPQMEETIGHLCSNMPLELSDGKEGIIFYREDFIEKLNLTEPFLFHPKMFPSWYQIYFFKMYISTSVGRKFKVKIDRSVRNMIWKQYLNSNDHSCSIRG